jgi:hypothetical protein
MSSSGVKLSKKTSTTAGKYPTDKADNGMNATGRKLPATFKMSVGSKTTLGKFARTAIAIFALSVFASVSFAQVVDPILRDWVRMKAYLNANYAGLGASGELSAVQYGLMVSKYAWYMEDWFEAGGYVANATTTNFSKFNETAGYGTWLVTVVDGGSDNAETISIMTDERNGILAMVPNNAANDSMNAQMQGESFRIRPGYTCGFCARFLPTGSNTTARVGLHLTGTTEAINSPGTDYIGFRLTNSVTSAITNNVYFEMAKNSTNTSVLCGSIPINSFAVIGFSVLNGTNLFATFNGSIVAGYTIGLVAPTVPTPDDEALSPVMASRSLDVNQGYLKIDYISTVQER